jgi:Lytic transglycolase
VRVPNLVGLSRVQVYRTMRADQLYFVTRGPGATNDRWRTVEAQLPRPGTVVARRSQVVLRVWMVPARGPRRLPNLVGRSRAEVFSLMHSLGLYFVTRGPGARDGRWVFASAQSPRPGTLVPWHGEVTVAVALSRPRRATPTTVVHPVSDPPANPANVKVGVATWYNYIPGQCATWYLPKGTTITVTDLATGKSVSCVITDREQPGDNHVVDLNQTQFAELAPLGQGVIRVKVTW